MAIPIIAQYDDCVVIPMVMSAKELVRPDQDSQSTPMETESEDQYRLFGPSTSSFDASLSSCKSELNLFLTSSLVLSSLFFMMPRKTFLTVLKMSF